MVNVEFKLSAFLRPAKDVEGLYVSFCPKLDMYSQGRTQEEAKQAIESAIGLWVQTCYERGVLEKALKQAGFTRMAAGTTLAPEAERISVLPAGLGEEFSVDVPLYLLNARQEVHA